MDKYQEKRWKEKFEIVLPMLTERQLRTYLAVESKFVGPGGISQVARLASVSRDTIHRGLKEIEFPGALEDAATKIRGEGGGRRKAEETQPGLIEALIALVDPTTRGDPMSPLRWTCKSTRNLSDTLKQNGYKASRQLVSRLLSEQGYSLQGNAKVLEGSSAADRDEQFKYVNSQILKFQEKGHPTISVDAKKKELVGAYKNGGKERQPKGQPEEVGVYDFINKDLGKAIPYGVYDIGQNAGWVSVGIDHDTSAFAVETIKQWWKGAGCLHYPLATELLIVADGGGSNGSRVRLWKAELSKLAQETGLIITVCHLPPGTSKWNKIEHRLFSHITMNWRGRPLVSHEVIVQLIGATKTRKGLTVQATLDTALYPTGIKLSDKEMEAIPIRRHIYRGEWNYTIGEPLVAQNV